MVVITTSGSGSSGVDVLVWVGKLVDVGVLVEARVEVNVGVWVVVDVVVGDDGRGVDVTIRPWGGLSVDDVGISMG